MQTRYAFRAATLAGRVVAGTEEAASEAAVRQVLARRQLFPLDVSLVGEPSRFRGRRAAAFTSRAADVAESIATLASLLEAGLPLDRAIEITQRGVARQEVADALGETVQSVREGGRLSESFARYPRLFPGVAVGLVRAADQGGDLALAMRRNATHLERVLRLRARISSAVMYPILLLIAGTVAMVVLVFYVLPRFVSLLSDAGSAIPASTRALLVASQWTTRFWPIPVILIAAAVVGWVRWRATVEGREHTDAWLLRLPIVGVLRAEQACARVARSLGTLLAGGMSLVPATEIASEASGDAAVQADLRDVLEALRRGVPFSLALARTPHVPHVMLRLVEVGEETGRLEALLERAAVMMEEDLERRLEQLITLVEPFLIALFGLVIGFVALALLQAIYGVNTSAF